MHPDDSAPFVQFMSSLRRSVDDKNWYSAMIFALNVPDMCAGLTHGKHQGPAVVAWIEQYFMPLYPALPFAQGSVWLTAGDLYALRCSIVHEATADISSQNAREVLELFRFTTTGGHCIRLENCQVTRPDGSVTLIPETLQMRVDNFCDDMWKAARAWYLAVRGDPTIETRIERLLFIK